MSNFVVINNQESFKFVQELYANEVLDFMGEPRRALMNRSHMEKLIQVGKDIHCDFWSILKEEFGENYVVEVKQKYEIPG